MAILEFYTQVNLRKNCEIKLWTNIYAYHWQATTGKVKKKKEKKTIKRHLKRKKKKGTGKGGNKRNPGASKKQEKNGDGYIHVDKSK